MTNDDADQAFQALHDAQQQAYLLYMDLRDAGDAVGADNANSRVARLQTEIDILINREIADWKAGVEKFIPQLESMAADVQTAIAGVASDVNNAKKVATAMQALDKILGVAIKFLG
jgi:uncharacterized UPF0160 family protein